MADLADALQDAPEKINDVDSRGRTARGGLPEKADPNIKDYIGRTALSKVGKNIECLELLLKANASVDSVDNVKHTVLHHNAMVGDFDTMSILLNATADLKTSLEENLLFRDTKTTYNLTALDIAVENENLSTMAALLASGVSAHGVEGSEPPVLRALRYNSVKSARYLVEEHDAQIPAHLPTGDTILHFLAESFLVGVETLEFVTSLRNEGKIEGIDTKLRSPNPLYSARATSRTVPYRLES